MGAGASEGLDKVLERMLMEEKMKQAAASDTAHLAETSRHNLAEEDVQSRQHQLMSMDTQARIRASEASSRATEAGRVRDDGRATAEAIPGNTMVPETDPAVGLMQNAGMGSILRGIKARPEVTTGPMQEGETRAEVPVDSVLKMRTAAQGEKAVADTRQQSEFDERVRHDKALENKPPAPAVSFITTDDGVMRADRRGGNATPVNGPDGKPLLPKSSAQVLNRRDMAGSVGSHFQETSDLLDEADKRGLLGPMAGRTFAEFMGGKIGSTGNAHDDELLGDLRMSLSMLRSGTASLHGRSGANAGIAKEIERKMDEGFMDPNMIRGSLKSLKSWVDKYATKPGAAATTGGGGDAYEEYLARTKK